MKKEHWIDIARAMIAVGTVLVPASALLVKCMLRVLVIAPVTHTGLYWSASWGLVCGITMSVIIWPYDHMGDCAIRLYDSIKASVRNASPGETSARYEPSRKSHRRDTESFEIRAPESLTHSVMVARSVGDNPRRTFDKDPQKIQTRKCKCSSRH